ncbi:MAG: YggT family protein [Anaerolineae bacterium]
MDDRPYYPPPKPEGGRFTLEDYERRNQLVRITRLVWLAFGILEAMIGLRVLLKLIAANPEAGFAQFVYNTTEVFLAPFAGLTVSPSAGGAVLEIPSLIAMIVYGLIAWGIVRVIWIVFDKSPVA